MAKSTKKALIVVLALGLMSVPTPRANENVLMSADLRVEANFGTCAASLPTLRKLLSDIAELATHLISRYSKSYSDDRPTAQHLRDDHRKFKKVGSIVDLNTDGSDPIPMDRIGVNTTTKVHYGHKEITDDTATPWDHR
ncbi:MAG: hypothetical protein Q9194_005590 [Teloschistes cf. exilis]